MRDLAMTLTERPVVLDGGLATQLEASVAGIRDDLAKAQAATLGMDADMLKRPVNVGFSGGENKRAEMVQMGIMAPRLAILDETDSGLDIDALRIVADGVNALRSPGFSALVITHYQRLLNHIVPDRVHVLSKGRITRSGGPELAHELEREGYVEVAA